MSLINDALKRAAEAQQQTASAPPPQAPLQPVDFGVRPRPFLRVVVFWLLLIAVALSVWFFSEWWHANHPPQLAQPADLPSAVPAPRAPPQAEVFASGPAIKVSTNIVFRDGRTREAGNPATAPAEARVESVPAAATNALPKAAPTVPSFPELKLQSVIYRPNSPAVLINGEMLQVGDEIKGARIVRIERYAVTVEWRGERRELSLPRL